MAKPITDFMVSLTKDLQEKRGVAESTATLYVKHLLALNNGIPFKNLSFLKNKDAIQALMNTYAKSTQTSILGGIVSVLTLWKDKPTYKGTYNWYYERMMEASKSAKETDTSKKTEKQEQNWLTWDAVLKRRQELLAGFEAGVKAKLMTPQTWHSILSYVLLSLYTEIPPRRNQDYQSLVVVKKWNEEMDATKNYYDVSKQRLIFNKYKTAKTHGRQVIDISKSDKLKSILNLYLKIHPKRKEAEYPLLVNSDGTALESVNAITRILNKVFGKQVGSSMLRHIYLSSKYNIDEMKEDADKMGHTVAQQRDYMKGEPKVEDLVKEPTRTNPKNEIVKLG